MDAWFDATVARFEYFLEFKMAMLQEASAPLVESILLLQQQQQQQQSEGGGATNAVEDGGAPSPPVVMALSSGLRVAPQTFLDAAHEFLETVYDGLDDGYTIAAEDNNARGGNVGETDTAASSSSTCNEFLYGELTPKGVRQLFDLPEVRHALSLDSLDGATLREEGQQHFMDRRSFVDLGSGVGKLVLEAACLLNAPRMLLSPPPSRSFVPCIGVELIASRHAVAMEAVERCGLLLGASGFSDPASSPSSNFVANASKLAAAVQQGGLGLVQPVLGSFFETFPGEDTAAVCFACALGFDEALTTQLCDRILLMSQKGMLKCAVLLLRKVPMAHPIFVSGVSAAATPGAAEQEEGEGRRGRAVHLETTWMNEAPAILVTFP